MPLYAQLVHEKLCLNVNLKELIYLYFTLSRRYVLRAGVKTMAQLVQLKLADTRGSQNDVYTSVNINGVH